MYKIVVSLTLELLGNSTLYHIVMLMIVLKYSAIGVSCNLSQYFHKLYFI